MATRSPVEVETTISGRGCRVFKWADIDHGDTIEPLVVGKYTDKTVQFTKGSVFGGNMSLQGSLDPAGSNYVTLTDAQGNAISAKSTDTIEQILENCYLIKPATAAGVAGVTVWLLLASTR